MPLVMPTMSTIFACGSAARAAACTAGESGSTYFVCADAKHGTKSNKSNFKLRDVAIVPPPGGTSPRGYLSVMGRSSNGGVTGIMKLTFFTSAGGAGYFPHHRKVCPGSKLSSAGLLALLLDKYVPSESLSMKYFFISAVMYNFSLSPGAFQFVNFRSVG